MRHSSARIVPFGEIGSMDVDEAPAIATVVTMSMDGGISMDVATLELD
jgi:hypothetical protein